MSGKKKIYSKGNSHKRRNAASPVELTPPTSAQRTEAPVAKKQRYHIEEEMTFNDISYRSSSPARALSNDDELPNTILTPELRAGTRIRTPSAKSAYMRSTTQHSHSQKNMGSAQGRALSLQVESEEEEPSDNDYDDGSTPIQAPRALKGDGQNRNAAATHRRTSDKIYVDCANTASDRVNRFERSEDRRDASLREDSYDGNTRNLANRRSPMDAYGMQDRRSRHATEEIRQAVSSRRQASRMSHPRTPSNSLVEYTSKRSQRTLRSHYDSVEADDDRIERRSSSLEQENCRGESKSLGEGHHSGRRQERSQSADNKDRSKSKKSPLWGPNDDDALSTHGVDEDIATSDLKAYNNAPVKDERVSERAVSNTSSSSSGLQDGKDMMPDLKLDEYDDQELPLLSNCEMRPSFTPLNASAKEVEFLDLNLFIPDLQDEELLMIDSAHNFELSIPYANIALCRPYAFELESGSNRLVWSNEFVSRNYPSVSVEKPRNVVGIMVGLVRNPNLKKSINLAFKSSYITRRIGILPSEMSLKRVVRLMGTKLQWPAVKASLDYGSIINFSVKGQSNTPSSPVAFRYARRAQNASTEAPKEVSGIPGGYYPSYLEFTSEVKVYDARKSGFRFTKENLNKLHELPEYTAFATGQDNELNTRCIVAVGYTLNAYGMPAERPSGYVKDCPTISTNVQFVIVLGVTPFEV